MFESFITSDHWKAHFKNEVFEVLKLNRYGSLQRRKARDIVEQSHFHITSDCLFTLLTNFVVFVP